MTDTAYGVEHATASGFDRAVAGVAAVVVLGAIMSILDTTSVNVAIDTLARDLRAPLATIQWVTTGYLLALATVIPLTGWAADRFGTARLFLAALALFLAGSALAGLAWSAGSLIAFRVLQGLGGGMIMPVGMTMLTQAAGPQRVGRVMGVVFVPMLLGPLLGPVLGGWLVDDASWRWIFFVNVPIGALALVLGVRLLPADRPQPTQRLDGRGLALLAPGLAAVVYGLAETAAAGGAGAARAVGPLLAGGALVAAFALHALRARAPLLDVRLFERRAVAAAAGTLGLFGAAFFGAMILLPLYFQVVRGESALRAGLLLAPQGLGAAVMLPLAGRVADRAGAGRVVLGGVALMIAGMAPLTQVGAHSSYALLAVALFVMGLGMGATGMPAFAAAYQTLGRAEVARATAALNIVQRVGGSVGTALVAVALSARLAAERGTPAEALAGAFGHAFWWPVVLMTAALGPAALLAGALRCSSRRRAGPRRR